MVVPAPPRKLELEPRTRSAEGEPGNLESTPAGRSHVDGTWSVPPSAHHSESGSYGVGQIMPGGVVRRNRCVRERVGVSSGAVGESREQAPRRGCRAVSWRSPEAERYMVHR